MESPDGLTGSLLRQVIRVPYLDREVQGIYGLQYLGKSLVDA